MGRAWPWVFGASLLACGPQITLDGEDTGDESGDAPTTSASASDTTGLLTTFDTGDVDVDVDDGTIIEDVGVRPGCNDGFGSNGGVCLAPGPIVATGASPRHLATGDIDGDGSDEILVSRSEDPRLVVARLSGDDLVLGPHELPGQVRFTVGDLDDDGRDDVATVLFEPPTIVVGYGPDLIPTTTPNPVETGSSVTYARSDTGPALLLEALSPMVGTLEVLVPSGADGFEVAGVGADLGGDLWGPNGATSIAPLPLGLGYACAAVVQPTCDFRCDNHARVYAGLGTAMAAGLILELGGPIRASAVGDLDGDGVPDIAFANYDGITRYAMDGSVELVSSIGLSGVDALAVGDFDGDGIDDLAAGIEGTGEIWLGVAWTEAPATEVLSPSEVLPHEIAVGDFDGNGRDDLAAIDDAGLLAVWLSHP